MVGRDAFHAALGPLQGLWARRGRRSGLRRPRHEDVLISVVRPPGRDAIEEVVAREWRGDVVIAPRENSSHVAAALPGWKAVSATLHLLGDAPQLPHVPAGAMRLFAPPELAAMTGCRPISCPSFASLTRPSQLAWPMVIRSRFATRRRRPRVCGISPSRSKAKVTKQGLCFRVLLASNENRRLEFVRS